MYYAYTLRVSITKWRQWGPLQLFRHRMHKGWVNQVGLGSIQARQEGKTGIRWIHQSKVLFFMLGSWHNDQASPMSFNLYREDIMACLSVCGWQINILGLQVSWWLRLHDAKQNTHSCCREKRSGEKEISEEELGNSSHSKIIAHHTGCFRLWYTTRPSWGNSSSAPWRLFVSITRCSNVCPGNPKMGRHLETPCTFETSVILTV